MAGYKAPDFNERVAAARAAKQSALDKLRNKPAPDPAAVAERQAASAAREAVAAERRRDRQLAADAVKAAKLAAKTAKAEAQAQADAAAAPTSRRPVLNAAELKAERDARYAARKAKHR